METTTVFDIQFEQYAKNLQGSEQEIVVYKEMARRWFNLGLKEGASVMFTEVNNKAREIRACLDEDFAFKNNMR